MRDYFLGSLGGEPELMKAQVKLLAVIDCDNDGEREILATFGVGYSCKPRGMLSLDYASGEIIWFYQRATSPLTHAIADINGDGALEIILGSMAPCTCPYDEEYPDCDSYVTALSNTGEELWKVYTGQGFQRISVSTADVDECEGTEIVGFGYEASENWGTLFVLNCKGEYLYRLEFDYSVIPGAVCDIDGEGTPEIVTADTQGHLIILSGNLQEQSSTSIEGKVNTASQLWVNDINGDGYLEIFLSLEKELLIFNKNLEIIPHPEPFPAPIRYGIANFFQCKNTLLVVSDKLYAYSYTTEGLPCPLWTITERNLTEEGTTNLKQAESTSAAGKLRISRIYYEKALDKFTKLEDEEKKTSISEKISILSEKIFKQDIKNGIILLALCDGGLCIFLLYSWLTKKWSRLGEGALLLSLPVLLGLFQVHQASGGYVQTFARYTVLALIGSTALILRENILGFMRTVAAILSGHKNMLVLSIVKSDGLYKVSVESIEEKFNPVKESREITFSKEMRENTIKRGEFMAGVLNQFSSADQDKVITYAEGVLRDNGATIYQNFIPEDFSNILREKFLLLEVEDPEIPWELMYSDNFFALKYAVSRRIVATAPVNIRNKQTRKRGALVISDPLENLPGARMECEIVYKRLKQKMGTTFVGGAQANVRRAANLFGQGFDIIHFAGHIDGGLVLSDGVMSPEEVKEFIIGTPIVVVNGCRSEELARAFLLGGAMAYVGTIYPVHDGSAARIAADFYDLCLQHQIGEALRRARESHMKDGVVWASFIMYGDPTLKLL